MAGNPKRAIEIPTIDTVLVTVKQGETEYALDTASKVEVTPQTETTDAVKLMIKGVLKAQKPGKTTLTGNTIVLTDNVFTPEVVKILQGGTIKYWQDANKSSEGADDKGYGVSSYTPPLTGSSEKIDPFTLCCYSAQYSAGGNIVQYEKIEYPNCHGDPVSLGSEDDVFRAPQYTINSLPEANEPPYKLSYLKELPTVDPVTAPGA